jgi:hypothetical protein
MVKIVHPLLSETASGKIGNRLVFSQRKSGQQVRVQKAQSDLITTDRTAQRLKYSNAVIAWWALTSAQRIEYKRLASEKNMTGYNLFMQEQLQVIPIIYFIFIAGATYFKIKKHSTDLSYVGESASYGGIVYSLSADDTHIYASGASARTIRKYLKSDLSYVGESASYGGDIRTLILKP